MTNLQNIIFIDLEASSLSAESWPIELGFCWIDERQKLRTASKRIKPHPSWPIEAWSIRSQRVHKITLDELESAEDATSVAQWALDRLSGALLLSDAAMHDSRWLNGLMATIGQRDVLKVESIQEEVRRQFRGDAMSMFFKANARGGSAHRAAADALRLGQAWRAAIRKQQKISEKAKM
jgi:DNA polymerase-3 subunit epsilon